MPSDGGKCIFRGCVERNDQDFISRSIDMVKKIIIEKAERLQKLPPGPFVEAKRTKQGLTRRGVEVIDLGELNPDPSLRDFFIPSLDKGETITPCDLGT